MFDYAIDGIFDRVRRYSGLGGGGAFMGAMPLCMYGRCLTLLWLQRAQIAPSK